MTLNPIQLLKQIRCQHNWRGWLYGYPTYTSVAQYNECERCGKRKTNWVVRPGEGYVSEQFRKDRAKPDAAAKGTLQTKQ